MTAPPEAKGAVIVMAIDAGECADFAFDWYVKYLHRPGNHVVCVHVPEGFDMEKAQKELAKGGQMPEHLEKVYSKIGDLEAKFKSRLTSHKIDGRILSIPSKNPGATLVSTAREEGAFAILMGSRGLSKLKKAILGSVSDYVVQHADTPVIVVRNKKAKDSTEEHSTSYPLLHELSLRSSASSSSHGSHSNNIHASKSPSASTKSKH